MNKSAVPSPEAQQANQTDDVAEVSSSSRYELFEFDLLGQGAHAVVYRGYDHHLKRHVAIKVLNDSVEPEDEIWAGAMYCASRSRQNNVSVLNVDPSRGWITMELMDCSLDKMAGNVKVPDIEAMLLDALQALKGIHSEGRWHGAVAPSNLMLDANGRLKVADARGFVAGQELTNHTGEQRHHAPEILHPKNFGRAGAQTDLYCLATSLLRVALGTKAYDKIASSGFTGFADWAQWHASSESTFPPVSTLITGISSRAASVLDSMLAKRTSDRCPSASEAFQAIHSPSDPSPTKTQETEREDQATLRKKSVVLHVGPNAGVGPASDNVSSNEAKFDWRAVAQQAIPFAIEHKGKCLAAMCLLAFGLFLWPTAPQEQETIRIFVADAETLQLGCTNASGQQVIAKSDSETPYFEVIPGRWEFTATNRAGQSERKDGLYRHDTTIRFNLKASDLERMIEHSLVVSVTPLSAKVEVQIHGRWTDVTSHLREARRSNKTVAEGTVSFGRNTATGGIMRPISTSVRVTCPGFVTRVESTEVYGESELAEIRLKRERRLLVSIEPASIANVVSVVANGTPLLLGKQGQFEVVLPDGIEAVQLFASAPGYLMDSNERRMRPLTEFPSQHVIRLVKEPTEVAPERDSGRVSVESEPGGAEIYVDGKRTEWTTPAVVEARVGKRALRLVLPGHETWFQTIDVAPSDEMDQPTVQAKLQAIEIMPRNFSPPYYLGN